MCEISYKKIVLPLLQTRLLPAYCTPRLPATHLLYRTEKNKKTKQVLYYHSLQKYPPPNTEPLEPLVYYNHSQPTAIPVPYSLYLYSFPRPLLPEPHSFIAVNGILVSPSLPQPLLQCMDELLTALGRYVDVPAPCSSRFFHRRQPRLRKMNVKILAQVQHFYSVR